MRAVLAMVGARSPLNRATLATYHMFSGIMFARQPLYGGFIRLVDLERGQIGWIYILHPVDVPASEIAGGTDGGHFF